MWLIEHAVTNIAANAKKHSIIFFITIIILTLSSLSLFIYDTSKQLVDGYQERYGSIVSIVANAERVLNETKAQPGEAIEAPMITSNDYEEYATSSYLKETMFEASLYINVDTQKAVGETTIAGANQDKKRKDKENMRIVAFTNRDLMSDFQKHIRYIKEGSVFQEARECIVSKDFADMNKLSLQDKISLPIEGSKEYFDIVISGIYTDTKEVTNVETLKGNPRNEILINYATLQEYLKSNPSRTNDVHRIAQYYLKNPYDIEAFAAELYDMGLSTQYDVFTDQKTYEKIVEPISVLKDISANFLFVILIIGVLLMGSLTIFMIRERKYEVGVLRAMGLKKGKITQLVLLENAFINLTALLIAFTLASIFVQPATNVLMNQQVAVIEEKYRGSGFGKDITQVIEQESSAITNLQIQVEPITLFKIFTVAILFVLLSSATSVLYIVRFQPIKILTQKE